MLGILLISSIVHQALGYSYTNVHGRIGHGHRNYNGYYGNHAGNQVNNGNHGYSQRMKHAAMLIPYIDRNGCRFLGDVVCNPADTDSTTYGYCVLSDENKNLWKKPTMEIVVAMCVPTGAIVLSNWCNDNERLLRAMGFIMDKGKHMTHYYHQNKYTVSLNPCILVAPPVIIIG